MHQPSTLLFPQTFLSKEPRPLYCLLLTAFLFLLFLLSLPFSPSPTPRPLPSLSLRSGTSPPVPSFAYLLTGSAGDSDRLLRLLLATYHPNNLYLLHLDRSAPKSQRVKLARAVRALPVVQSSRNVHVVGDAGFSNQRGASTLAVTLHGAAVLLRLGTGWDWFVTLDASDYPLVTQDDLLHVFSFLPRDLNFIQHTSYIGWKESRRIRPVVVDPSLYLLTRTDIFYATQKRDLPNAYRLFTGSSSVILSRKFIEYCILGTENLPRTLLMYYANMPAPHLNYFQTVLCNSPEFNSTVVNDHLHYLKYVSSAQKEPFYLTVDDMSNLTHSSAAFGAKFGKGDPILDRIDEEILGRGHKRMVPGGWCLGEGRGDPCTVWGGSDVIRPGLRAMKLAEYVAGLLSGERFHGTQCIWD
ncbi:hypothetical protein LUZ62_015784 [Rhynchospora pubera]|uniref:Beta-glucuronosyltransferase GlcAT14A n=1 Tax=Rhynchospora pubera TaxID=906938 RepID=A0AAV8E5V3_9POAL|nr:hypothetical protein LUZ62_058449 [Rhynchospora pubera]KAJ4803218.1 hypothetical protein LUZ62_015784 [Rhynchospora pubera]